MTRAELNAALSDELEVTENAANNIVSTVLRLITGELVEGNEVRLPGFGVFSVKERGERQGRNPQTGEAVTIPASKAVVFKAGKALKESVNN